MFKRFYKTEIFLKSLLNVQPFVYLFVVVKYKNASLVYMYIYINNNLSTVFLVIGILNMSTVYIIKSIISAYAAVFISLKIFIENNMCNRIMCLANDNRQKNKNLRIII